ncbi:hypothetical protein AC1031_009548 [Aphanomyces cochlioides]|nr:hypothetical protein AC1031_009548 [Aphanomyces cochlioides]
MKANATSIGTAFGAALKTAPTKRMPAICVSYMVESRDADLKGAKATPDVMGCVVSMAPASASCAKPTAARLLPTPEAAQIDGYCLRHYEEIANPDLLTNEEVVILSTLLKDVNIDSATDEEHFGFAAPDGVDI